MREKKQEKAALRKEVMENLVNPYNVGQILYDSWGYEQTNIDFYQIVEVKPKSVVIQPIAGRNAGDYVFMSNYVEPVKDAFIGSATVKPLCFYLKQDGEPQIYIKSRHGWISEYKGEKIYESHYA